MSKIKPLLVFGTRHGTIFNVTPNMLPKQLPGIHLSVGDFHQRKVTLSKMPKGWSFKKFCGYGEDVKTYLSSYDFFMADRIKQISDTKIVKIKGYNGYQEYDASVYDELAELIDPDYLVGLCQYVQGSDEFLLKRAMAKVLCYLASSSFLKKERASKLLVPLHISRDIKTTQNQLQKILSFENIDGLVLCNLCEGETLKEREDIYRKITKMLEETKKNYVLSLSGLGKLEDVEHGIKSGVSLFQVNYPFLLAQNSMALLKKGDQFEQKKPQLVASLDPLDSQCTCYSCSRHSQAYIAHLVTCKQPNAKILLSVHNMHNYIEFINKQ